MDEIFVLIPITHMLVELYLIVMFVRLFTNLIFRSVPNGKFRSTVVAAFSFPPLLSSQFERHEWPWIRRHSSQLLQISTLLHINRLQLKFAIKFRTYNGRSLIVSLSQYSHFNSPPSNNHIPNL